jgi:hypothetical protein
MQAMNPQRQRFFRKLAKKKNVHPQLKARGHMHAHVCELAIQCLSGGPAVPEPLFC